MWMKLVREPQMSLRRNLLPVRWQAKVPIFVYFYMEVWRLKAWWRWSSWGEMQQSCYINSFILTCTIKTAILCKQIVYVVCFFAPQAGVVRHVVLPGRQQEEIKLDDVSFWSRSGASALAGQDITFGTNLRWLFVFFNLSTMPSFIADEGQMSKYEEFCVYKRLYGVSKCTVFKFFFSFFPQWLKLIRKPF